MVKKILLILAFVVVIGAGGFGTYHFYSENKNQIQQNQALAAQNSQIQAELNSIGTLVTVYEVSTKVYSGRQIKESDLIPVSVPMSTNGASSITDISQLIGKYYKVDINPGTILSADMIMAEKDETKKVYSREITLTSIPVSTIVGDYIDIRMILPNGEEYVVLSHERIERLYDTTITLHVSEEENAILNSVFGDLGSYNGFVLCYATKYLEPGKDTDTIAFYPVQHEMENFILYNPNIEDTTRCINTTLRDHIDEILLVFTDDHNQSVAQAFISSLSAQYSSQLAAHQMWLEEVTDEDGNIVVEGNPSYGDNSSFDQQVGEAMDSLEQGIADLEAIQ